jgi:hypothetical protein
MSETSPVPEGEQLCIPETLPVPAGLKIIDESQLLAYRNALIEADGDEEKAGIDLATMRNIIYTCRMKANPLQEAEEAPKAKRASKGPSPAANKLTGIDINSLMG